jgi:RNA polymerase sigma-70 factor (ECF subfamily)
VERFWDRIRLFALRRMATATEAEDVAQETLRRVLEALRQGRLRQPEALPSFVFQTAQNVCRNRHRSERRQGRAFERLRSAASGVATAPDPLAELLADGTRGKVRRALSRLEDQDRELLRMSFYLSLDTTEVARRLEVTTGAVRVRRHRALRRLRAILEEPE